MSTIAKATSCILQHVGRMKNLTLCRRLRGFIAASADGARRKASLLMLFPICFLVISGTIKDNLTPGAFQTWFLATNGTSRRSFGRHRGSIFCDTIYMIYYVCDDPLPSAVRWEQGDNLNFFFFFFY
jgi:hypothetical protein